MLLATVQVARTELIVLTDGRVIKAVSHRITGEQIEIRLAEGNSYSFSLARVEQIVDDEVLGAQVQAIQAPTPASQVQSARAMPSAQARLLDPPVVRKRLLTEHQRVLRRHSRRHR
jgi:hypothetical protein